MILCNNVRELRFAHGQLTQAELARAVGVSRQTIISIEKNRYTPSVALALRISSFFKAENAINGEVLLTIFTYPIP